MIVANRAVFATSNAVIVRKVVASHTGSAEILGSAGAALIGTWQTCGVYGVHGCGEAGGADLVGAAAEVGVAKLEGGSEEKEEGTNLKHCIIGIVQNKAQSVQKNKFHFSF